MKRAFALAILIAGLAAAAIADPIAADAFGGLLFGWYYFLQRVLPAVRVNIPSIVTGAVALALFILGGHLGARWLWRETHAELDRDAKHWKWEWTLSIVAVVVLMFVCGIATIGVVHQTGWILASDESRWDYSLPDDYLVEDSRSRLKQIGLGIANYADVYRRFPPGGSFSSTGEAMHSWEAMLLPYMMISTSINYDLPWRHPDNQPEFRIVNPMFINPDFRAIQFRDAEGFAVSHYAANSHVMGPNLSFRQKFITDGLATTIFVGEVNSNFKAWGDPSNWRDPMLGINQSPYGFGGVWGSGGAQFLMGDGSVQMLSESTDLQVLRALSTPDRKDDPSKILD